VDVVNVFGVGGAGPGGVGGEDGACVGLGWTGIKVTWVVKVQKTTSFKSVVNETEATKNKEVSATNVRHRLCPWLGNLPGAVNRRTPRHRPHPITNRAMLP